MYVLTEQLLSFNWQRFTLHKNEKRNLELYRKIPSSTNLLNSPRICPNIWKSLSYPKYTETWNPFWPRGYKTFFMLNSAEHEIFSANKY